jgi:hypothetical protein
LSVTLNPKAPEAAKGEEPAKAIAETK